MEEIKVKFNEQGRGAFTIEDGDERVAEMDLGIAGNNLTVYHTEVAEKLKGKGVAGQLLTRLAEYAREHKLKVIPLCTYVQAQFKRHPERYEDIWNRNWHA